MRALALALLALIAITPADAAEAPLAPAPVLAEDGFYHPDWFLMSFLDLAEDSRDAAKQGKRVAIMVEQRGCAACKRVHEVNLRHPRIVDQLRRSFEIIQIDLYGSREITDFDGTVFSEKDYAKKLGVRSTPTLLFLKAPDEAPKGGLDGIAWSVTGYLEPDPFAAAFRFVASGATKGQARPDFLAWLKNPANRDPLP